MNETPIWDELVAEHGDPLADTEVTEMHNLAGERVVRHLVSLPLPNETEEEVPTYTFERIQRRTTRSGRCPACGRRTRRSRTFEQTVSPFNKNEDGTIKTREQVQEDVAREVASWQPDFHHQTCKEG